MRSLLDPPPAHAIARFADGCPRFLLTVDTEEEFDWSQPFARAGHTLTHLGRLAAFQRFAEEAGVVPIYLVDWPVAKAVQAVEQLGDAIASGRGEIGVQLHPWVNPPFSEALDETNSYAGNLPPQLEAAKFALLREAIAQGFGVEPQIYRAGRYGVGHNTARLLSREGIAIDSSVRANFDYSATGGPDFSRHPSVPYWLDDAQTLLELPLTTVFWGLLRQLGGALYPRLWRQPAALRSGLARAGLLERISLTPEGISAPEAVRAIDVALDDGLPLLVLSFHSPSLAPGHTPYVQSAQDLDRLYDWWRVILAHLARRAVRPSCVADVLRSVVRQPSGTTLAAARGSG